MRTTLTLEPDVAALLRKAMKQSRRSLKEVVNEGLRAALEGMVSTPKVRPYRLTPHDGGKVLYPLDSVSEALTYAEGEGRR